MQHRFQIDQVRQVMQHIEKKGVVPTLIAVGVRIMLTAGLACYPSG